MVLEFDPQKNIATIKLAGALDQDTILRAFDAAVADDRYQSGMGRLWDFREADLSSLDPKTIALMAQHSTKFPPGINDVKVAFVADKRLEFGLSRMFEAYSMDVAATVSVFEEMEEAQAWLSQ